MPLPRREFLAAATGILNPWLISGLLGDVPSAAPIRRLVCIGLDLSLRPENFFPTAPGPEYELTPLLKPIDRWRGRMSVFSQLDHPGVNGGHNAVPAYLSGVRQEQAAGFPHGILSLDQFAAGTLGLETRFPSLTLGVGGGDSISWTRAGIAVPKLDRPRQAFDLLFRPTPERERESRRKTIASNRIAADLVRQDILALGPLLAPRDRAKLDEFQSSLFEFENGLVRSENWLDRPIPETSAEPPSPNGDGCLDDVRAMFDLIALAFRADATRIASYNIGYNLPVAKNIPGVDQSYHDLSHSGQDPEKLEQLGRIENHLMIEFDRFLSRLDELRDDTGTSLLDNTIVLFGSGMGNASSHSNRNLPIILAGGGFKHGRHLFFEKSGRSQTPLCNLYVTILQHLGLQADRFGSSDGNLNELLG